MLQALVFPGYLCTLSSKSLHDKGADHLLGFWNHINRLAGG